MYADRNSSQNLTPTTAATTTLTAYRIGNRSSDHTAEKVSIMSAHHPAVNEMSKTSDMSLSY